MYKIPFQPVAVSIPHFGKIATFTAESTSMSLYIKNIPSKIRTRIFLPASKSMSNRLLMISALSGGNIRPLNLSDSDDTRIMTELLKSNEKIKNAGHAGTTMRFLTAYFAQGDQEVVLNGTERMKKRPIGELVERLRELGADIEYLENQGFPPLKIRGKELQGGKIKIDSGISSQYISALLMIAPGIKGGLEMELTGDTISSSYINMTLSLMRDSGAHCEKEGNIIRVNNQPYGKGDLTAEPDWSSASYWFMIAGLLPDSEILLKDLKKESYQGDAMITFMFESLGVSAIFNSNGLLLKYSDASPGTFRYDFRENPDMVQSFIPYCIARDIPFYFSGCRTLRIKETDRVSALHAELLKFGVQVSFSEDGDLIWWDGKTKADWKKNISIKTYKDHRMAMGFAPLAIKTGEITIEDPGVVSKSYPTFWKDLEKAGFILSEK